MTEDVKAQQDVLLHRIKKIGGKYPTEVLKGILQVIEWKRISLEDADISAYQIFELEGKGFVCFVEQREEIRDTKTKHLHIEKCVYMVKFGN